MNTERLGSIFWMAVGLGFIYGSTILGVGKLQEPGAGLLPFLAGSCLAFMSLILFFRTFARREKMGIRVGSLWKGLDWRRPLITAFVLLGYIWCLERIGFIPCSFLLLFFLLKVLGNYPWGKATTISFVATTCSYLVFSVLLKVMLPMGILQHLL